MINLHPSWWRGGSNLDNIYCFSFPSAQNSPYAEVVHFGGHVPIPSTRMSCEYPNRCGKARLPGRISGYRASGQYSTASISWSSNYHQQHSCFLPDIQNRSNYIKLMNEGGHGRAETGHAAKRGDYFQRGAFLRPCAGKAFMKLMNINLYSPKTDRKCSRAFEWMIKEKNKSGGKITVYGAREALQ